MKIEVLGNLLKLHFYVLFVESITLKIGLKCLQVVYLVDFLEMVCVVEVQHGFSQVTQCLLIKLGEPKVYMYLSNDGYVFEFAALIGQCFLYLLSLFYSMISMVDFDIKLHLARCAG